MSRKVLFVAVGITIIFLWFFAYIVQGQTKPKIDQAKLRDGLKGLIQLQAEVLERTEKSLTESRETADTLWAELGEAQLQVNKVGTERDSWKAYGEDQHEKFINAEKRVAEEKVKKQRWFMLFSGLAIVVALYFGLKFFTPIGKFIP